MGTVTITSAAFAALPATAPAGWPTTLTWPGAGNINGTKVYNISDSDAQQLISWIATTYQTQLIGTSTPPVTVTAIAIILAWLNGFMQASINSTQQHGTTPPVVPPPISIA